MEDGHSLGREGGLEYCEGPWDLGEIKEDGAIGALESRGGR